jgi:hypothetical protein
MTTPTIIETDLREVLAQINQKLDGINDIRVELAEIRGDIKSLDKRLEQVEGSQNRQIWALIGILFTAVVATAIRFVFVSLPNFQ